MAGDRRMERVHMADNLIGTNQKIPDWLIERIFLGEGETAIRPDIKSKFVIMGF